MDVQGGRSIQYSLCYVYLMFNVTCVLGPFSDALCYERGHDDANVRTLCMFIIVFSLHLFRLSRCIWYLLRGQCPYFCTFSANMCQQWLICVFFLFQKLGAEFSKPINSTLVQTRAFVSTLISSWLQNGRQTFPLQRMVSLREESHDAHESYHLGLPDQATQTHLCEINKWSLFLYPSGNFILQLQWNMCKGNTKTNQPNLLRWYTSTRWIAEVLLPYTFEWLLSRPDSRRIVAPNSCTKAENESMDGGTVNDNNTPGNIKIGRIMGLLFLQIQNIELVCSPP